MRDIRNLFVKFNSTASKNEALNSEEAEKIFFTPTGDIILNGIDYTNHQDYILASQKGVANGVASLDGSGKVPDSQIPEDVVRVNGIDKIPSSMLPSYVDDVIEMVGCYSPSNPLGSGHLYRPTDAHGQLILGLKREDTEYFIDRGLPGETELWGTPEVNPDNIYFDLLDGICYVWNGETGDDFSHGWAMMTNGSAVHHTDPYGEGGKIYIEPASGKCYRWSGQRMVEISASPGSSDDVVEGVTNKYYTAARAAEKAEKSEMSVTPGTGADADKTTIQLKSGLSATVLTEHMPRAVPSVQGVGGTDGYLDRTDFQLLMSGNVAQRWT